jgi:hypothetical protein
MKMGPAEPVATQSGWLGPLTLVATRTVFLLLGQAIVALLLGYGTGTFPWQAAGAWWTVFGSLADVACLALMLIFLRKEGLGLKSLLGNWRGWRDVRKGLGYYFLLFPIHLVAYFVSARLVYGGWSAVFPTGVLHMRVLPVWAMIYSVVVWWVVWSATEEATYQAYVLPRLQRLTGKPWLAIGIVWFWWTAQHCVLPLIPDWKYVLWRFLAFAPGMLPTILLYHRNRRLAPMIVAHWPMDLVVAATTLIH